MGNTSSKEEVNLLTKIGEGSYTVVYKAAWKNRQVAAKKLRSCLAEKTDVKQKFREEWELLSGLNHPNIVKYLTAVIPESPMESTIIVTELLDQDLRRFIMTSQTKPKVTFRDTVSIMLDVAEGLNYLHQLPKPIVHRDLACKNILLTVTKQAKIADFGVAKCFPEGEMAATGDPGTPATRAPETFGKSYFSREKKKKYGTKADVFSFGVVVLEIIVGHPSVRISELDTEDGRIVPEAIRRREDLYDLKPEHPLRPLVLQCLQNSPDDRPTAHDLVNTLSDFKDINDRVTAGQHDYEFKVVMVGDQRVGKTRIATKFVRPCLPFEDNLPNTIAYAEYNKRIQLKGKSILLQIVDTSGQYNTTSSLPQLYRGAHGAAVVFDVGSWDSLVNVRQWVSMVRERCGCEIPIILVGNKTDSEPREVSFETAENVSVEFNLFHIEVSAKTGENIQEIFSLLIEQLMRQRDQCTTSSSLFTCSISSLLSSSSRCHEPSERITAMDQVPRKIAEKDPDSISFMQGDKNGNASSSSSPCSISIFGMGSSFLRRFQPPAQTDRDQVPRKVIEKDPDIISLMQGDKSGNTPSSSPSTSSVFGMVSAFRRRFKSPARITAREPVLPKIIEKDPDSMCLMQADEGGDSSSSSSPSTSSVSSLLRTFQRRLKPLARITEQLMQQGELRTPCFPSASSVCSLLSTPSQHYDLSERITTRDQVPQNKIETDPDSNSLIEGDERGNASSSPSASSVSSLLSTSLRRFKPSPRITEQLRQQVDHRGTCSPSASSVSSLLSISPCCYEPPTRITEQLMQQIDVWDFSSSMPADSASVDEIKLGNKIGGGSFGEVFKAVWRGKQVAAKRIHPIFFDGDHDGSVRAAFLEKFKSEWEILRSLQHDNIVQYYTVILPPAPETPIIVTELMERDLAKYIRESKNIPRVSFAEVVKLMLDVAKALHYLHYLEPPIAHCNLASRNVLLTKSMDAKIGDLGVVKAFPYGEIYATPVPGTSPYAAPETYYEKFGGKTRNGEKIDIFSFGVLTLETIVGHLPNRVLPDPVLEDGEIVPEYIRRSEDLEEMGLDHPLHSLVYQCVETIPEDRPSAAEIIETLQKFSTTVEGKSSENELRPQDPKTSMPKFEERQGSVEGIVNCEESELRPQDTKTTMPKFKENQGSVEGIVNSEGGVLFAEDVQVIFPTGAISKLEGHMAIKIVLEKPYTHCDMIVKNGLENEVMFIAPVINLQPNGQVFKKPVTLQTKLTTEIDASRSSDVLILHGTQAKDGKIVWEDITHQAKIDLQRKELKVEMNKFSRIAALLRLTSILAKNVVTRLNVLGFNYTMSVLFKDNCPHSPLGELALVFMSHDVYNETCYREHPSSVLMQLKASGYEKLCSIDRPQGNRIYHNENLKASLILGQDYEIADGQLESIDVVVDSSTWWSTGHVIKWPLKGTDGVRILCGKIGIEGQFGHILRETFCGLDTCEYVRRLLRVEGSIFNLIPIARKLKVPEEAVKEAIKSWQKDEEQLKIILQHWSMGQEERCNADPAILRNILQGLNSKDCEVDERGKMHIDHLRELAFEIHSLNREDTHLKEYFTNQIRTLCRDSILKDCCIELDADVSVENYPRFLSIRQQVTEDVALTLETICSSSTTPINEDFFSIIPFLIQAVKDIFRKENHLIVQNGLKGLPIESINQHESKVRDAFLNKDIFKLVSEVCRVLESLCLNNCEEHSTEEIKNWSESLGIWNMSEFLKKFFQSPQDGKLHKRLQLFSRSLRRISEDVCKIKEIEMRSFYNVSLNLIKFATFDPSKLVRFEIIDSTYSPVTCYSEAIKYDRPHDTFSQQFEIRKESEDELQLGAIARVHLNGRIRKVGAFESVIVLPSGNEVKLARFPISSLQVAVKTERTGSGNLQVVLSSTRRETISKALCVLQRELGDDIVDPGQVEITKSHLKVCCFVEAVGLVRLRLLYKWRSEAISVDSKHFLAIGESSATDPSPSAWDSGLPGVTYSRSPLATQLDALSIASLSGDENGNFVMDPSAVEIFETHARQQYGRLELHLHQTFQKGHVCVTGNSTSLHMNTPNTAQRFLQAGLCAPSQQSLTAGPSSNEGEVSEPQNTSQSTRMK